MRTWIIGIGNTLRGDDAAGVRVAEQLTGTVPPGVEVRQAPQVMLEWAAEAARFDRVVLCDAAPGTNEVELVPLAGSEGAASSASHAVGLPVLAGAARRLFGADPEWWVCRLPAERFELGAGLSPAAEAGVAVAVVRLRRWLQPPVEK